MYAEELERWIARFHQRQAALLFNSGYDANLGLMSCLPQRGDAVVCDELVHNSIMVSSCVAVTHALEYLNALTLFDTLACMGMIVYSCTAVY